MNTNEPVAVYTTQDLYEAEIVKNALQNEGIMCEIDGTNQGGFVELFDVRLVVRAADADRAREIIESHQRSASSELSEESSSDLTEE